MKMTNATMPDTPATRRWNAYHESGHATIAIMFNIPFKSVTVDRVVIDRGGGLQDAAFKMPAQAREFVAVGSAGVIASQIAVQRGCFPNFDYHGFTALDWITSGSRTDLQMMFAGLESHGWGKEAANQFIGETNVTTWRYVTHAWPAIAAMAEVLAERRTMSRAEAEQIVDRELEGVVTLCRLN